jgi:hypothetical protein
MAEDDLLESLYARDADQFEFEQLLLTHFGNGASAVPEEIEYRHQGDVQAALILHYSEDGVLGRIERGPGLLAADVPDLQRKIREVLLAPTAERIGVRVLFAAPPIKRWFRFKNEFQIVPAPSEAPRPEFLMGDHPVMLEVPFRTTSDPQIRLLRRMRREREIELLCGALFLGLKGSIGQNTRHHWVLATNPASGSDWASRYCQGAYVWPGQVSERDSFSSVEGVPAATRIVADKYYALHGASVDRDFEVPDSIDALLAAFFSSSRQDQDHFLRAAFWFQHAQRSFSVSQSAAYTALVSAIEALVPPPLGQTRCKECNQNVGSGPTQRFVEFIERYAPTPWVDKRERRKLYAVRSSITHGGRLLHHDRVAWGGFTARGLQDMQDVTAMWRLVRVAFVNWLLRRD